MQSETVVYVSIGVGITATLAYSVAARWVPDRAIGTIGLIMAGLGLISEFYQLLVQIVTT